MLIRLFLNICVPFKRKRVLNPTLYITTCRFYFFLSLIPYESRFKASILCKFENRNWEWCYGRIHWFHWERRHEVSLICCFLLSARLLLFIIMIIIVIIFIKWSLLKRITVSGFLLISVYNVIFINHWTVILFIYLLLLFF